ncbi:MAG: hypothetical protein HY319_32250 [Armatimonadetes bacterium]|nr:hypothetical protein [Armatimonadota bacterium]
MVRSPELRDEARGGAGTNININGNNTTVNNINCSSCDKLLDALSKNLCEPGKCHGKEDPQQAGQGQEGQQAGQGQEGQKAGQEQPGQEAGQGGGQPKKGGGGGPQQAGGPQEAGQEGGPKDINQELQGMAMAVLQAALGADQGSAGGSGGSPDQMAQALGQKYQAAGGAENKQIAQQTHQLVQLAMALSGGGAQAGGPGAGAPPLGAGGPGGPGGPAGPGPAAVPRPPAGIKAA